MGTKQVAQVTKYAVRNYTVDLMPTTLSQKYLLHKERVEGGCNENNVAFKIQCHFLKDFKV